MIYICFALFLLYNILLFVYSKSLYAKEINILPFAIGLAPVNFAIIYASVYITKFNHDYLIMLAFIAVYTIEFKLLFSQSYVKTFFGTISFALNLFAMRTILLSSISLIKQIPVSEAVQDVDVRLLVTLITLFLRPFTIRRAMKTINKDQIFMIFSNKNNLLFSLGILTLTFAYQLATSILLDVHTTSLNITVYLLGVGIFCLGIYIGTMAHAYEFSKLHLQQKIFKRLKDKVKKEAKQLKELKTAANIEPFTQTYNRKAAEEKLTAFVTAKEKFYIIYIDIDGLKIANDKYGHEEGDFYIKAIAELLLSIFSNEFVARMGGDEFLIIGTIDDEYEIAKKVLMCYENSKNIASNFEKPYETSISYGIVEANKRNTLSAQELLSIADKKMYDFKREHKKAR